jgi:hypothetical protein
MCWRCRPGLLPEPLPKRVVRTMRGIDLGDRPAPQLPQRVLEVVSGWRRLDSRPLQNPR